MALRLIKNNKFLVVTICAYIAVLIFNPSTAAESVDNSWYYIREMLQIMPVIFLLTALLDAWLPKKLIMQYLGESSKLKGILLSFLLGSVSAGPIYAAFPICIMLLKKGASIRNIVIILSAWAVVKVPMLIVEAKFLGIQFMVVRWILTVTAILVFSGIIGKIVDKKDLPQAAEKDIESKVSIKEEYCMGCTVCTKIYPELFELCGKKAHVKEGFDIDMKKAAEAEESCPVQAIQVSR